MSESAAISRPKPLTRFGEFELLKAIAILGLPLVHVMEEAVEAGAASPGLEGFGSLIFGLCIFGPSVFMICMGFGIGGGRTSPESVMRTGVQFLLIGAILNVLRWLVPGMLSVLIGKATVGETLYFCFESDIYYFAGTYFVLYSYLKRLKLSTGSVLMISLLMLTANTLLTPLTARLPEKTVLTSLLGNLVYCDDGSCFPLLSWSVFPTVGVLLGEILKKASEERRENLMRRILDFSAVVLVAFGVFLWNYGVDIIKVIVSPSNAYITDLPNVILLVALALLLVCAAYYLCKYIGSSKFMAFMLKVSAFIVPFYLLQWVIIAWIFYLYTDFGTPGTFNLFWYFLTVVLVTAFCTFMATHFGMRIMKVLTKLTYIKKRRRKAKAAQG